MVFVKLTKTKAYFKRYQTKLRRRREGKTDFQARRALVIQDKNKYNTPKFRLVVRFTNSDVIVQLIYSKIIGDVVVTAAYAHELSRYGLPVGHTNFSAAYATGLLAARRHLAKVGLADQYKGDAEVTGEYAEPVFERSDEHKRLPFRALLDIGLVRTTTGHRVFAALKGAVDGGLNVPHSVNRFAGYNSEESKLDAAALRSRILGHHVSNYMRHLEGENPESYQRQFSGYIKAGIKADGLEKTLLNTFSQIRANPQAQKKPAKTYDKKAPRAVGHPKKLTLNARKAGIANRKNAIKQRRAKAAKE